MVNDISIRDNNLDEEYNYNFEFTFRHIEYANNNNIFVISPYNISEKLRGAKNPDEIKMYFEVWDWNGRQIARYVLDRPIEAFVVINNHVIGYSSFVGNEIYVFTLPKEGD